MDIVEISESSARAAQSSIDALAHELEAGGKFPDLTYIEAPVATSAAAEVEQAWAGRLSAEVAGIESVGFAFTVVAETFTTSDESLSSTLNDLEMARVNAGDDR